MSGRRSGRSMQARAAVGFQPIWTRLGRQVIQNLTTVTTSVRGFTTLLLGLYFAEQAVEQRRADEANFSDLFLKIPSGFT